MSNEVLHIPSDGLYFEYFLSPGSGLVSSFKLLSARLEAYERSLGDRYQLGIVLTGFSDSRPINVTFLQLQKPSILSVSGFDADDKKIDRSLDIKDGCVITLQLRKVHVPYGRPMRISHDWPDPIA